MTCYWCGREIKNEYYLKYDGEIFCRDKDDRCVKDYLYDKFDAEISMNLEGAECGPRLGDAYEK